MVDLKIGDTLTIQTKVTKKSAASNYGSKQLEKLFATPPLVALMIEASAKLVDKSLDEGFVSVAKKLNVTHFKPSMVGETISVKVTVTDVSSERVDVAMEAYDEIGSIGAGHNERHVVNRKGLLKEAKKREEKLESIDF